MAFRFLLRAYRFLAAPCPHLEQVPAAAAESTRAPTVPRPTGRQALRLHHHSRLPLLQHPSKKPENRNPTPKCRKLWVLRPKGTLLTRPNPSCVPCGQQLILIELNCLIEMQDTERAGRNHTRSSAQLQVDGSHSTPFLSLIPILNHSFVCF